MGFGGGGGSGAVDYPDYMKTWHENALGGSSSFGSKTMAFLLDNAIGNSPFATMTAYDPATPIYQMENAVVALQVIAGDFTGASMWNTYASSAVSTAVSTILPSTTISGVIAAYNAQVEADLNNNLLPRFRRGMQDINAVCSSAFVVGESLIECEALRNQNRFAAELLLQNYKERVQVILAGISDMVKLASIKMDIEKASTQYTLEQNRLRIIAEKEQEDQEIHLAEIDGKWDLEAWSYGGNLLASIGSASVRTGQQTSPLLSALGGGMVGLGGLLSLLAMF